MKDFKLIECRNIDNDVAEILLPTLSNKKMNEVMGGTSCGKEYENGNLFCGSKFVIQVCAMNLACGKKFSWGTIGCGSAYTDTRPCGSFAV